MIVFCSLPIYTDFPSLWLIELPSVLIFDVDCIYNCSPLVQRRKQKKYDWIIEE